MDRSGDADDERNAVEVTATCIAKLNESNHKDRIGFRPPMRLDELFLGRTVPYSKKDSVQKQLRMRYRINGDFATLVTHSEPPIPFLSYLTLIPSSSSSSSQILNFSPHHTVLKPFLLIIPSDLTDPTHFKPRYLRLLSANYGHPRGMSSTGRMSYDVVEVLQHLVDMAGGSFLK
jgi:hypothetical protein